MASDRPKFRFMDLEIWRDAMEVAKRLFGVADKLEVRRLYRSAEQLCGSGMYMSNNIAEDSRKGEPCSNTRGAQELPAPAIANPTATVLALAGRRTGHRHAE